MLLVSGAQAGPLTGYDDVFAQASCSARGVLLCRRDAAGPFHVLLLNASTGQAMGESAAIPLPGWEGFDCSLQVDGDCLLGTWSCSEVFHWGNRPGQSAAHAYRPRHVRGPPARHGAADAPRAAADRRDQQPAPLDTATITPRRTPLEAFSAGGRSFRIETDSRTNNTVTERTLICTNAAGEQSWRHPLRPERLWLLP